MDTLKGACCWLADILWLKGFAIEVQFSVDAVIGRIPALASTLSASKSLENSSRTSSVLPVGRLFSVKLGRHRCGKPDCCQLTLWPDSQTANNFAMTASVLFCQLGALMQPIQNILQTCNESSIKFFLSKMPLAVHCMSASVGIAIETKCRTQLSQPLTMVSLCTTSCSVLMS